MTEKQKITSFVTWTRFSEFTSVQKKMARRQIMFPEDIEHERPREIRYRENLEEKKQRQIAAMVSFKKKILKYIYYLFRTNLVVTFGNYFSLMNVICRQKRD